MTVLDYINKQFRDEVVGRLNALLGGGERIAELSAEQFFDRVFGPSLEKYISFYTVVQPYSSSSARYNTTEVTQNTPALCRRIEGAGYCDMIMMFHLAEANTQWTYFKVYCDGAIAFNYGFKDLNTLGCDKTTPPLMLSNYNEDGACSMILTKRFEFRESLELWALNNKDDVVVYTRIFPTLIRQQ